MKKIFLFILFTLSFSLNLYAKDLTCQYENQDNTIGEVMLTIESTKILIKHNNVEISSDQCTISVIPEKIEVECFEPSNTIGISLELKQGKFEGIIMIEKAMIIGSASC